MLGSVQECFGIELHAGWDSPVEPSMHTVNCSKKERLSLIPVEEEAVQYTRTSLVFHIRLTKGAETSLPLDAAPPLLPAFPRYNAISFDACPQGLSICTVSG